MELSDYVFDKETVHEQAEVYQGEESMTGKGTLACTSKRLVFVSGKDVTDISINNVTAMEYSAKRYPRNYLYGGIVLALLGVALEAMAGATPLPAEVSGIVGLGGALLLILGAFLQRASLKIHTPNKTFNFTSSTDLADMAHMIRAQESQ